jgi:hypothetical protein
VERLHLPCRPSLGYAFGAQHQRRLGAELTCPRAGSSTKEFSDQAITVAFASENARDEIERSSTSPCPNAYTLEVRPE